MLHLRLLGHKFTWNCLPQTLQLDIVFDETTPASLEIQTLPSIDDFFPIKVTALLHYPQGIRIIWGEPVAFSVSHYLELFTSTALTGIAAGHPLSVVTADNFGLGLATGPRAVEETNSAKTTANLSGKVALLCTDVYQKSS